MSEMEKLLVEIMNARSMSMAELTRRLGYRSKTSITRIMKDQASDRAVETFARRMNDALDLTSEEREWFDAIVKRILRQDDALEEMLYFLRGKSDAGGEMRLESRDGRETLVQRYQNAGNLRVILLNSQYTSVFSQLLSLTRGRGAKIEHFLRDYERPAPLIRTFNALIPLLYEHGYEGYAHFFQGGMKGGFQGC